MLLSFVVIPVGVFALMLPVVHGVFGVTSPYQLLSVILSTLFILFYPLSIALHLIGFGGVFDDVLVWLFALPKEADEHILPVWAVGVYAIAALCAIRWRTAFWILGVMAVGYGIYLYLLLG